MTWNGREASDPENQKKLICLVEREVNSLRGH